MPAAQREDSPSSNKSVALDECDLIFCTQEMSYQFPVNYSVAYKMPYFRLMRCMKNVAMLELDSVGLLSNVCV
jgi:hypothetical protein